MKKNAKRVLFLSLFLLTLSFLFSCKITFPANTTSCEHIPTVVVENEEREFCDTEGTYDEVTYCTECKKELKREEKTLPPSEHDFSENICSVCGYIADSKGLTFMLNADGAYTVTGIGTATDKTLKIPSEYNGTEVTAIGSNAFSSSSFTAVIIPEGVTSIGAGSFMNCSSLTDITVPDSVEEVGRSAFSGCSKLLYIERLGVRYLGNEKNPYVILVKARNGIDTSYEVPEGTKCILDSAFDSFDKITEITLPKTLTFIGYRAFRYCESLEKITIPDETVFVGAEAFSGCSSLLEANVGNGLYELSERMFYSCAALRTLSLGKSIDKIGEDAIQGCSSLESISVDSGNSFFKSDSGVLYTKYSGRLINYPPKKSDSTYTVIEGTRFIGERAFSDAKALKQVILPDGLLHIEVSAFSGCSSLEAISIPDSIELVGGGAFRGCEALVYNEKDSVCYLGNATNPYAVLVKGKKEDITSVNIADTTRIICNDAFYYYSLIENLTIPDSVIYIGDAAFQYCQSVTRLTLGRNVKYIGDSAFYDCKKLRYLTIPDSVTELGESVFRGCLALRSVTIGEGIKVLPKFAFSYCTRLGSVVMPEGIVEIEESAFYYCTSLSKVVLPKTLKTIGAEAFYDCESLNDITFGKNLKTIGASAFSGCKSLVSVILPSSVEFILDFAFNRCKNLVDFSIPSSVSVVGEGVFNGCVALDTNEYGGGKYLGNETNPYLLLVSVSSEIESISLHTDTELILFGALDGLDKSLCREFEGGLYIGNAENPYLVFVALKNTEIGEITVHSDTEIVCADILSGGSLKKVVFGNNLRKISSCAFSSFYSLESAVFSSDSQFILYDTYDGASVTLSKEDVSNPSVMAEYLKDEYSDFEWKRI